MKFSEKLIILRKNKKWSQEDLGNKLGVARQTVSKWELGETTPEMDKLLKMSEIFEITLDELMKEEDTNIESENINKPSNSKAKFIKYLGVFLIIVLTIIIIKTIIVLVSAKVFEFNPNSQFIEETEVVEEQIKEDSNF